VFKHANFWHHGSAKNCAFLISYCTVREKQPLNLNFFPPTSSDITVPNFATQVASLATGAVSSEII